MVTLISRIDNMRRELALLRFRHANLLYARNEVAFELAEVEAEIKALELILALVGDHESEGEGNGHDS